MIASDPGILLGALEVSKLRKTTREKINSALLNARHEDLLYGMIVAEGRLVSVIRPRRHSLHPPGTPHIPPLCPLPLSSILLVLNALSFLTNERHATPLLNGFQQHLLPQRKRTLDPPVSPQIQCQRISTRLYLGRRQCRHNSHQRR